VIPAPKMPRMYPKQQAAIFSPSRYSFVDASTKSGKTAGCLVWLLTQAWNGPKDVNYWWVAPVYQQTIMAYDRMAFMLRSWDVSRKLWSTNKTQLWAKLPNGARIWFKSGERPDSLFGEDVYSAVIDEASRVREEAWHAIRSTLTSTEGPVRIIGNVKGRRNWAYKLGQMAKSGQPNMDYHKLTAYDAIDGGIISKDEVEDAKRLLPESVFNELYLAQPSDDQGNPFGFDAIKRCITPQMSDRPAQVYGVDLARSHDWTVIVGLDEYGRVTHLERFQKNWAATRHRIIEVIGDTPALLDATGVGDPIVEDVSRHCPNAQRFVFTSKSKQDIMLGLASVLQQTQVSIPAGWLIDELESFEYEVKRNSVSYSAPQGMHDDGVCALAMAVHKLGGYSGGPARFAFVETDDEEYYEDEMIWN